MQRLSFIGICLLLFQVALGQSPHGEKFTPDCNDCHTSKSWSELRKNLNFDHASTRFELTGQHNQIDCKSCHDKLVFSEAPEYCNECHLDMHSNSLGQDCERCHTTESWIVTNINEVHYMSRFPLSGAHQTASCMDCHKTFDQLRFEVIGIECFDCHREDYLSTRSPNHQGNGYSFKCEECHGMSFTGWTGGDFNHNFFPLTGGHSISCTECHTSGSFEKLSTECYSCHQQDFEGTKDPNHISLGFSQDCNFCHTNHPDWQPATFNIHDNYYILTGAHASIRNNCAACHNGNYNNTANTCYECHNSNYNNAADPNHLAAGFPTECESCHSQSSWEPSTYNHDSQYFPIYSGKHQGEWNSCSDCHTQTNNFTLFSCIDCHEHNQSEMNSEHQNISGYAYNSASCFSCHPNGREN